MRYVFEITTPNSLGESFLTPESLSRFLTKAAGAQVTARQLSGPTAPPGEVAPTSPDGVQGEPA